jgi:putative pre-16S rRNA nuclease
MAIDYGTKKIGLAFSDPTLNFVSRTLTIKYKSIKEAVNTIVQMIADEEVHQIILGLPLNDDGTAGKMVEQVDQFRKRLKKQTSVEIILSDERYTSEEAQKYLHLSGKKIKGNREKIDAISAALILNDHLMDNREV